MGCEQCARKCGITFGSWVSWWLLIAPCPISLSKATIPFSWASPTWSAEGGLSNMISNMSTVHRSSAKSMCEVLLAHRRFLCTDNWPRKPRVNSHTLSCVTETQGGFSRPGAIQRCRVTLLDKSHSCGFYRWLGTLPSLSATWCLQHPSHSKAWGEGLESTQQAFCEDALKKRQDSQVSFKCTWPGFISVMVMKISWRKAT